ncbi:MAG: sulfatase-like hydrolase/transferase [Planctomycetota bacterium]
MLVADYQNPHDICEWIGEHAGSFCNEENVSEGLPPLPDNFEIDDFSNLPVPVKYLCCTNKRMSQASNWSHTEYRHYLKAYYHYVQKVDNEIGKILKALSESKYQDETLILLASDHGEGMAAHRLVTKQIGFYEEATRIPFIIKEPGKSDIPAENKNIPVTLLDIFPTLCHYAGIETPQNLPGNNLFKRRTDKNNHYAVCEWHGQNDSFISPGRMLYDNKIKYIKFIEDSGEELYDIENDPGEKLNLVKDSNYSKELEHCRKKLKSHCIKTNDPFFTVAVKIDKNFRGKHPEGYHNHSIKN